MQITNSILNQYGFHDASISKIEIDSDSLSFVFNDGVYCLENGKEIKKTDKCKVILKLLKFNDPLDNYIELYKIRRNHYKAITLQDLIELLKNCKFDITDLYLSNFSQSILLVGYIGKLKISFSVCDIKESELQFVDL